MDRLRVLQVGLGDWGRDWAWRVVPAVTEVESVGFVDSNPSVFETLSRHHEIDPARCFTSVKAAVDATAPDAVLVTTTLGGHEPLTRAALEAGLHVLVEKPFTDDIERAHELVAMAAAKSRVLMVSQNYRWFPASRLASRLVRERTLGDVYSISIDFRRNAASPPRPAGRHHTDAQPLLIDMSVHHFDLLRMLLSREPMSVSCQALPQPWSGFAGPPAAIASITFDGVVVSYRGSWVSAGPITPWAGEWNMEFEAGNVHWTSRGDRGALNDRVIVRPRRGRPRVMPLPEMARIDRAGALTEFAAAIREGREPETSGRDNLATLRFMLAAVDSARHGREVAVQSPAPAQA